MHMYIHIYPYTYYTYPPPAYNTGGVNASGKVINDIFLLQMSVDAPCAWRVLVICIYIYTHIIYCIDDFFPAYITGGVNASGKVINDIFLLQMSLDAPCAWRALVEWPSSVLEGDAAPACRGASMAFLGPSKFFIFGGIDEVYIYIYIYSCSCLSLIDIYIYIYTYI